MLQPKLLAADNRLDRLHELTDCLNGCLAEAEDVRARFVKALDANAWPDIGTAPGAARLDDDNPHGRARR